MTRSLLLAASLAWPQAVLACSVCFSGEEESRFAFLATTIFMSLLPLAFIGGTVGWIWRRARAAT